MFVVVPVLGAPAARGVGSLVVISQIYGNGGRPGAAYARDYVEIFNRGGASVDLSLWSLQVRAAGADAWTVVPLAGSLPASQYVLVGLGSTGAAGPPLPGPDVTGGVDVDAAGGTVAIRSNREPLRTGARPGPGVVDLVAYGTGQPYEGRAAPAASDPRHAIVRALGGCADTDDNAVDVAPQEAAPSNAVSPGNWCAGAYPPVTVGFGLDRSLVRRGGLVGGRMDLMPPGSTLRVGTDGAAFAWNATVASGGAFALRLPFEMAPGGYTLRATGPRRRGEPMTFRAPITVTGSSVGLPPVRTAAPVPRGGTVPSPRVVPRSTRSPGPVEVLGVTLTPPPIDEAPVLAAVSPIRAPTGGAPAPAPGSAGWRPLLLAAIVFLLAAGSVEADRRLRSRW